MSASITASEFRDRIVLVSGGHQGIGLALSQRFHALGARVIALDIKFEYSHEFTKNSLGYYQQQLDISNLDHVQALVARIENMWGDIDHLVHAAGILHMGKLLDMGAEDWLETFNVNSHGCFYLTRTVAKYMCQRRRGSIVSIGSNASGIPRVDMGAYAASKAASSQMMKCLGLELAEFNVRCNIVAPGSTDTPMQRKLWRGGNNEQHVIDGNLSHHRLGIPLQRIAQVDDVVELALFLLSDKARHITMESILIDGGASLGC